jgi:hypothetical protein
VNVNIREFYADKQTGEEKPGKKGILISLEQWKQLYSQLDKINQAVVSSSGSNSTCNISIEEEEMEEKVVGESKVEEKEMKEIEVEEKVVAEKEFEFENLESSVNAEEISPAIKEAASSKKGSKRARSDGEGADPIVKKAKNSINNMEEIVFSFATMRKVTVGMFKGKLLVNIREYYNDKDTGEEKPGMKGVALSKEQWISFFSQKDAINSVLATAAKQERVFDLGDLRKVTVGSFKGAPPTKLNQMFDQLLLKL